VNDAQVFSANISSFLSEPELCGRLDKIIYILQYFIQNKKIREASGYGSTLAIVRNHTYYKYKLTTFYRRYTIEVDLNNPT
jgi:hypothetical protein